MRAGIVALYFVPVVIAAIGLEIAWFGYGLRRAYPWRELAASLAIFVLRLPVRAVAGAVLVPVFGLVWAHRVATVPLHTVWGLALLFVGEEFAYYWSHRLGHRVRWVWASHAVHHTPTHLHLASAFRLGLTDVFSGGWLVYLPLVLLGLNPVALFATLAANLTYQFWLHTDQVGTLGPVEWVFNTPAHHRVHHAANAAYIDRNYGGILIVFDRMFGTYAQLRADDPPVYGVKGRALSHNPLALAFREWGYLARDVWRARGVRARFRAAFGPPEAAAHAPPAA
jgi:sterol desaturase/sphingolipid hydroxylase (fatty acid hydroxylase superfamily)